MLEIKVDKSQIPRAIDGEFHALSHRVRLATEKAGREILLDPVREMTRRSLNSAKLPTAWRGVVFPKAEEDTLAPAFFVWSKAPKIIAAFEDGPTIRPLGGRKYLWIPTENVPRTRGGGRMTPGEVAQKVGPFVFRRVKGGGVVALAAATKSHSRSRRRGASRQGNPGALRLKKGGEMLAFFVLKKQVRLRKRLDVKGVAERAGATYAQRYQRAANAS